MELPSAFLNGMRTLLGEEYPSFLECWQGTAHRGLRRNPLKCGEAQLWEALPFPIEPTAFSPLSYRFNGGKKGWAACLPITLACSTSRNPPPVPL